MKPLRSFKFRAWIPHIPKLVYFNGFNLNYRDGIILEAKESDPQSNLELSHDLNVIYTPCVFVKDKHGKELYEGDIIRFNKIKRYIIWSDNCCAWFAVEHDQDDNPLPISRWIEDAWFYDPKETFEIIGNIFEHPNL